jgi:hypothetical protein
MDDREDREQKLAARLAKLPQWARDHVSMLENRIEHRDREIAGLEQRLAPDAITSNVFAGRPYGGVMEALGMWTPITFGDGDHRRSFQVEAEEDGDSRSGIALSVRSSDGSIQVQPVTGNVVLIRGISR